MSFSKNLSELRARRGQSQRAAARDLNISQSLLSHYENGAREPGLSFVIRVCEYYGVTADYILGRTDDSQPFAGGRLEAAQNYLKDALSGELRDSIERYLTLAVYKMAAIIASECDAETLTALGAQLVLSELAVLGRAGDFDPPPLPAEMRHDMAELVATAKKNINYPAYKDANLYDA